LSPHLLIGQQGIHIKASVINWNHSKFFHWIKAGTFYELIYIKEYLWSSLSIEILNWLMTVTEAAIGVQLTLETAMQEVTYSFFQKCSE
jgi:hypothetical protein